MIHVFERLECNSLIYHFVICFKFVKHFWKSINNISHWQTRRRLGKNRWITLCDRWSADNRPPCSRYCKQLQLLLSSWNRSGRNAKSELQPCYKLPVFAWDTGWVNLEWSLNMEMEIESLCFWKANISRKLHFLNHHRIWI